MAARIISVTFETDSDSRPGVFSVPHSAANLLGLKSGAPVHLRITWEGRKLQLSTSLRSGLEVHPRWTDESTHGLDAIPPKTPILVTVWPADEAPDDAAIADANGWTDERFDRRFAESAVGDESSAVSQRYRQTYRKVLRRFKELRPDATKTQAVLPQNWLEFSAGRTGYVFAWSMAAGRYFRAELYIDVGDKSANTRALEALQAAAPELYEAIGEPIAWERLEKKRGCRVAVYYDRLRDDFEIDDAMVEWAANTMAKMVDVLRPMVRRL